MARPSRENLNFQQDMKEREEKAEGIRKQINAMTEKLKGEGYKFEIQETFNEYVITLPDRVTHIHKQDPFRLKPEEGDEFMAKIEDVVRASITNPGENASDVLRNKSGNKKAS